MRQRSCGDAFLNGDSKLCSCSSGERVKRENGNIGDWRADLGEEGAHAGLEDVDAKIFGVAAEGSWRPLDVLKARYRGGEVFRLRAIKEDAGDAVYDCLDSAPCTVGDGRPAGGGDLERRHAEVFFTGKDERAAAGGVVLHFCIRKVS